MNTNIRDMPLEIFCDYVSEYTGQEWNIEILCSIIVYGAKRSRNHGCGLEYSLHNNAYINFAYYSNNILFRIRSGFGFSYWDSGSGFIYGYEYHNQ